MRDDSSDRFVTNEENTILKQDGHTSRADHTWWVDRAMAVNCHVFATAVIAVLFALPYVGQASLELLAISVQSDVLAWDSLLKVAAHVGLSACVWALVCAVYRRVRRHWPDRRVAKVSTSSGSVMLETLIAMPVILLLAFGLAQLVVINLASILFNLASFQAARTAWLWQPESSVDGDNSRMGVDDETVEDMVRIQAAAVLTPVAPGDYQMLTSVSDRAKKARGMFLGSQSPIPIEDSGKQGIKLGNTVAGMSAASSFVGSQHTSPGRWIPRRMWCEAPGNLPSRTWPCPTTVWSSTGSKKTARSMSRSR